MIYNSGGSSPLLVKKYSLPYKEGLIGNAEIITAGNSRASFFITSCADATEIYINAIHDDGFIPQITPIANVSIPLGSTPQEAVLLCIDGVNLAFPPTGFSAAADPLVDQMFWITAPDIRNGDNLAGTSNGPETVISTSPFFGGYTASGLLIEINNPTAEQLLMTWDYCRVKDQDWYFTIAYDPPIISHTDEVLSIIFVNGSWGGAYTPLPGDTLLDGYRKLELTHNLNDESLLIHLFVEKNQGTEASLGLRRFYGMEDVFHENGIFTVNDFSWDPLPCTIWRAIIYIYKCLEAAATINGELEVLGGGGQPGGGGLPGGGGINPPIFP